MSVTPRFGIFVSRYGPYLAGALVILGALALANAGLIATTPTTETVSEETAIQSAGTQVETRSVVENGSGLYREGETLVEMPVYFFRSNPTVTIAVTSSVPADVDSTVRTRLSIRQTASRDGREYFSTNRTLIDRTDRTTAGTVVTSAAVNMSRLQAAVSENRSQTEGIGSFQTVLHLAVEYQTDQYSGSFEGTSEIEFTRGAYWFDGDISESRRHSTTVTREVTRPPDRARYLSFGLLGVLLLGAAGGVFFLYRRVDVDSLSLAADHDQFQEWISRGEFPTSTDKRYIAIHELADLVDIAIDSNKRVIYDDALEVYSVVDGDLVYYYSRDAFNIDVWLDT